MTSLRPIPCLLFVLTSCLFLAQGCISYKSVSITTSPKDTLAADPCFTQGDSLPCHVALLDAAHRRDPQLTGQRLFFVSLDEALPEAERQQLAQFALWLNPAPEISPERLAQLPSSLTTLQVPDAPIPAGAILLFGDVDPPEALQDNLPVVRLPVIPPNSMGALTHDALLNLATSSLGAFAAASNDTAFLPAAPLFQRILGVPVGASRRANAAILIAQADVAFQSGDATAALFGVRDALAALSDDAPPCSVRGAYLELEQHLAALASDDVDDHDAFDASCNEALELDEAEANIGAFLRETRFYNHNAQLTERPAQWASPEALKRYHKRLESLSRQLGGVPAARLDAISASVRALTLSPEGPCDDFDARKHKQDSIARDALEASGSTYATLHKRMRYIVHDDNILNPDGIEALIAWLDKPEHHWLRVQGLSSAINKATGSALLFKDNVAMRSLCARWFDSLQTQLTRDTFPDAASRNAARLNAASLSALGCPDTSKLDALYKLTFDQALSDEDPGAAVFSLISSSLSGLAIAMISGRSQDAQRSAARFNSGLNSIRDKLSASPEHKAIDATLNMAEALTRRIFEGSDPTSRLQQAEQSLKALKTVAVTPDSPTLLKAAPGLKLLARALMAVNAALDGDTDAAVGHIKQIGDTLSDDLAALLTNLDAPDHSGALAEIFRATYAMADAFNTPTSQKLASASKHLRALRDANPGEEGWWAVGLGAARVILLDLSTQLEAPPQERLNAISRASNLLDGLIVRAFSDFDLRHSSWRLLKLLPTLNDTIMRLVTSDEQALNQELNALKPKIADALIKARSAAGDASRVKTLLDVTLDLVEIANNVGFADLLDNKIEARIAFGEQLFAINTSYPPRLRIYTEMFAAMLLADRKPEHAQAALKRAEILFNANISDKAFLPDVLAAQIHFDNNDPAKTLAAVERVLSVAREAESCGKQHEVLSLLPIKAWAEERLGKTGEAAATYRAYRAQLASGFSGDGTLTCTFKARQDGFVGTLDVSLRFNPSSMGDDNTFNVGLGWENKDNVNSSSLTCASAALPSPHHDVIIHTALVQALFAFRRGDDRAGHRALLDALSSGNIILHGSPEALGPDAANVLQESRARLHRPLILGAAFVARQRGQVHTARQLEQLATAVARLKEVSLKEELDAHDTLYGSLHGFDDFEELIPLLKRWTTTQEPAAIPDVQKTLSGFAKRSALIPDWGPALAANTLMAWVGELDDARDKARRLKTPKAPIGRAATQAWIAVLGDPGETTLEGALSVTRPLMEAGLWGEASKTAMILSGKLKGAQQQQALLDKTLDAMPPDAPAQAYLELMTMSLGTWRQRGDLGRLRRAVDEIAGGPSGRVQLDAELQARELLTSFLGNTGSDALLLKHLETTIPLFERMAGQQHLAVINLKLAQLSLEGQRQPPAQSRIGLLSRQVQGVKGDTKALKTYLKTLRREDREAQLKAIDAFLLTLFPGRAQR